MRWVFDAYNRLLPPEKQIRFSPSYKVPFQDIAASHPVYKFVQALTNAGFSVGYDNKTFKPDKPMTREEMIAIKHGVDSGEMYSNVATNFYDDAQIDPRFHNSVYSEQIFSKDGLRGNYIMRSFGAIKAFKPKEVALRYEAAATLWQMDHRGAVTADVVLGRKPAS